jgi:hypothetical protein
VSVPRHSDVHFHRPESSRTADTQSCYFGVSNKQNMSILHLVLVILLLSSPSASPLSPPRPPFLAHASLNAFYLESQV